MVDTQCLNDFKITTEQIQILYNIEFLKTQNDISLTEDFKKKKLKEEWITEWKKSISLGFSGFTNQNNIPMLWFNTGTELKQRLSTMEPHNIWFRLILIESMLFTPYFPVTTETNNKGENVLSKKYDKLKTINDTSGDDFLNSLFKDESYFQNDYILRLRKYYKRVIKELSEDTKSKLIMVGIFTAIFIPIILASGVFSAPLAVALVGSHFIGLSGAALSSACLAYLGGGALAIGGAGLAGGAVAVIGGGGALGFAMGTTAAAGSKYVLNKKSYILQSAKLLLAVHEIYLVDENDLEHANSIYEIYIENIEKCEKQLDQLKYELVTAEGDKKKEIKMTIKQYKESLEVMKTTKKCLEKIIKSFQQNGMIAI